MNERIRDSRVILVILLSLLTTATSRTQVQRAAQTNQETHVSEATAIASMGSLNINNLWLRIRNDGITGGLSYPLHHGNLLYSDNLIWVGKVHDGKVPELRTGGGIWQSGVRPGSIVADGVAEDSMSEGVRVFRYRPDYRTADLTFDAAASNGVQSTQVTPAMVEALRNSYEKDEAEWPWQKGAPFIDTNRNGKMDAGEKPGLQSAHQIAWFSYNDLDEERCKSFAGGPSIGLEVQVTLWAYKGVPNLEDVIFKRYRLLYKGTNSTTPGSAIDSMYITQWADPDIGLGTNDLGGCDSTLSLGYVFNATEPDPVYRDLGGANPALGYAILQGPLVAGSSSDHGIFNFEIRPGRKNLAMTSFLLNSTGDPISEPSYNLRTFWYWNIARGFTPFDWNRLSETPWTEPNQHTTKFMFSGDPVSGTGWIDGLGRMWGNAVSAPPGEKRFMASTGPFTMALGDTQEVVIAMIASAAPTGVENVTWLRNRARYVQAILPSLGEYVTGFVTGISVDQNLPTEFALDQNYPNPFNPITHVRFAIPRSGEVRLSVFDLLGQEICVLSSGSLPAGEHIVAWDGRNALGNSAPSGVYFYRLTFGDRQSTRKLLLLR